MPKQLIELPKEVELIKCPKDGLILQNKRWVPLDPTKFIKQLAKVCGEVDVWEVLPTEGAIDVEVTGWLGPGIQKRERHKIQLKIKKRLCDVHSSIAGGYWEALLQLRGGWDGEHFHFAEHMLEKIREKDKWAFHMDEPVKGGMDIFCGSKQAAWKVAQELKSKYNAKIVKSTRVIGKKNNKALKRLTISVRFPEKFNPVPNV